MEVQQTVEEVGALTEVSGDVGQGRLDDHPRRRDLAPPHRHAEAIVGGSPAAEPDVNAVPSLVHEAPVDRLQLRRNGSGAGAVECLWANVDDVLEVGPGAVAEAVVGRRQRSLGQEVALLDRELFAGAHHRAHLEEIELHRQAALGVEISGDFDLDLGARHLARQLYQPRHHLVEGDGPRAQQRREGQDARSVATEAGLQPVRAGVVGGGQELEGSVALRVADCRTHQALGLAGRVVRRQLAHVDRPEIGLGVLEEIAHALERGRGRRPLRAVAPAVAVVDDGLAQAESQRDHPFFRFISGGRVVVVGAGQA